MLVPAQELIPLTEVIAVFREEIQYGLSQREIHRQCSNLHEMLSHGVG